MQIQDGIRDFFNLLSELTDNYLYISDIKTGTFLYSSQLVDVFQLPDNILRDPLPVWKEIIHPQDWPRFEKANTGIGTNGHDFHSVYFRAKAFDGEYILMKCKGKVLRNEDGEPFLFAGIMTELGAANKKDSLSAIRSRKVLNKKLDKKCLNTSGSEPFAVMEVDIDNMSLLNEMYGRDSGDFIIQQVRHIIGEVLEGKGTVYKLESNCFAIVMDRLSEDEISDIFVKIQNEIHNSPSLLTFGALINISAGCAFYPQDASDRSTLLSICDITLKRAKNKGKNRLVFYDVSLWTQEKRNYQISNCLEKGKKTDFSEFYLQYQPQIDIETKKIYGVEALLRWNSQELGSVSPMEFIPVLEQNGLIIPLGLWVFRQAVKTCKKWLAYDPDFFISINVSVIQITHSNFAADIRQIVEEEQFPAGNIILELTESSIVENTAVFNNTLQELRQLGFKIAIDDFGTGYSALGILKNLHVDLVKIDKIFVHNITDSSSDKVFIKSITEFCHCIDFKVLLEGVETQEEFDAVRPLGIDFIQGFFFGRPQNAEQITENYFLHS